MLASCWWYQPPPSPSGTGSDSGTLLGSRGCLFISTTSERFFFLKLLYCFSTWTKQVLQYSFSAWVEVFGIYGTLPCPWQLADIWCLMNQHASFGTVSTIFFFLCILLSDCVIFKISIFFRGFFFHFLGVFFVYKQVVYVLKDTVNTIVIILQNERLFNCRDSWSTLLRICRKWAVCEF